MAKRRSAKAAAAPKRARKRVADMVLSPLRRFAVNRALDGAGLALITLGLACLLALVSHSPRDPSFSVATAAEPRNWLGGFGAYASDALLLIFGAAAPLFVMPWFAWGAWLTFFRHRPEIGRPFWLHGLAWVFGTLFMAMFASALPLPGNRAEAGVGVGGLLGDSLLGGVSGWIPAGGAWPHFLVGALSLLFGTLLFGYAIGFRRRDFAAATGASVRAGFGGASALSSSAWRLSQRVLESETLAKLPPFLSRFARKPAAPAIEREEPRAAGETWDEDFIAEPSVPRPQRAPAAAREARVQRPDIAPKAGTRERAEQQRMLDLGDSEFSLPELSLLSKGKPVDPGTELSDESLEQNARLLEGVLLDFGVKGEIIHVRPGPVVTLYELEPAPGVKSSRVIALADDIARSMSAVACRVAVVTGRNVIGIELPNSTREVVYLRELLASQQYEQTNAALALVLGKDIGGAPVIADLARMPHLLIAGTTGSGKSVGINTMILSLLYRLPPEKCKFIMVDPKMLELSVYDGIPQLLAPVVTEPKKAIVALRWTVKEMERRYLAMSKHGVRNLDGYNQRLLDFKAKGEVPTERVQAGVDPEGQPVFEEKPLPLDPLPFIVVIVDEMADLMLVAGKDIEAAVQRLAQMARAAGIHLIMATQRPSVDVITGTIKANFPTRVSFQVTSKIDSRTILGEQGAEQLLGQGDMLFMAGGGRITRVHGPFVSETEVERVVKHLKAQGQPSYIEQVTQDEDEEDPLGIGADGEEGEDASLYRQAVEIVLREGKASTSFIQRKLQIGYNRAARLVERMEEEGIVSPANHAGKREILREM